MRIRTSNLRKQVILNSCHSSIFTISGRLLYWSDCRSCFIRSQLQVDCCFTMLTQPHFRLPSHLTRFQSPSGKTSWPGTSAQDCESPLVSKALGRKQVFNLLNDYIIMKVLFKFVCFIFFYITSVSFIVDLLAGFGLCFAETRKTNWKERLQISAWLHTEMLNLNNLHKLHNLSKFTKLFLKNGIFFTSPVNVSSP